MTAPQEKPFVVTHKRLGSYLARVSSPDLGGMLCSDPASAIRYPSYKEAEAARLALDEFRDAYEVRTVA
jgi:hypothetical protein